MPKPYQERIALPSMQPHHVEQIVRMARARQDEAMQLAERTMDERGTDDLNPSLMARPLVVG